eukprot:Amastigsp_a512407_34.p4 type:complete len:109 gc:universal Amastigsp_a512407_34:727-1053(+)
MTVKRAPGDVAVPPWVVVTVMGNSPGDVNAGVVHVIEPTDDAVTTHAWPSMVTASTELSTVSLDEPPGSEPSGTAVPESHVPVNAMGSLPAALPTVVVSEVTAGGGMA